MGRIIKEEFIIRAKEIHGPDVYDYSFVEYVNNSTKVKIICPDHGIFEQQPNNHLYGQGCKKCKGYKVHDSESFIEEAKCKHNNKYDYSFVEYVNAKTKVKIICPEHGVFEQTPSNHLHIKKYGCKYCGGTTKSNTEDFIKKANKIHGHYYDYSLVEYVDDNTKVKIICFNHGTYEQAAGSHLQGSRCPKCSRRISLNQQKLFNLLKIEIPNIVLEQTIKINNKNYFVDIFIPDKNLIIEYYGDYWHCNPERYKSDFYNKKKNMYAKDIWKYDNQRKNELESFGYKAIIVWESDFKNNQENIVKDIVKIIDNTETIC